MKNKLFTTLLVVIMVVPTLAQNDLSDYSFVSVPRKFDFLAKEDQYQLNSLAKFLFNKYGFNASFPEELPAVNRCEGLYATVIGEPNMIWTKVTVILKDCNGLEVYRSNVGKSKLKAYNKTYTDAMRKAFLSFDELNVSQKEPTIIVSETKSTSQGPVEVGEAAGVKASKTSKEELELNLPKERYTSLLKGEETYLLTKTKDSYLLYRDFTATNNDAGLVFNGKVLMEEDRLYFEDVSGNRSMAFFDKKGNLIIEQRGNNIVYTKQ